MQIVIDIPEEDYRQIKEYYEKNDTVEATYSYIYHGTPLPKGHKIIDEYALQEHLALVPMEDRTYREAVEIIDWFPSIIEADRGEGGGEK